MNLYNETAPFVSVFSVGADVVFMVDSDCAHCTAVMAMFVDVDGYGSSRVEIKFRHGMWSKCCAVMHRGIFHRLLPGLTTTISG